MILEPTDKIDSEYLSAILNTTHTIVLHIRRLPNHNGTIDITAVENHDDTDEPNSLRVHEILLVICVLLLWCASIIIFIRHSELLRIRHRDLPFRSDRESSTNLNRIAAIHHASDLFMHSKSAVSSTGGLTPPINNSHNHSHIHNHNHRLNEFRNGDRLDTLSLAIPLSPKKRPYTRSVDLNALPRRNGSFDKPYGTENLLHPYRITTARKSSLHKLHHSSADDFYTTSVGNVSLRKYATFFSTNDMSKRKHCLSHQLIIKTTNAQESPV